MARYIALYKRYDTKLGLLPEKYYTLLAEKSSDGKIRVWVTDAGQPVDPLLYTSKEEFLADWHILRTWKGKSSS